MHQLVLGYSAPARPRGVVLRSALVYRDRDPLLNLHLYYNCTHCTSATLEQASSPHLGAFNDRLSQKTNHISSRIIRLRKLTAVSYSPIHHIPANMGRVTYDPLAPPSRAKPADPMIDLDRLLSRLQQTILRADVERERRLRTSEYEREKAGFVS